MNFKEKIAEIIEIEEVDKQDIAGNIMAVQEASMGDFCLPCFKYSKQLKRSPAQIADMLCARINAHSYDWLEKAESVNGYLNFFLKSAYIAASVLEEVIGRGSDWQPKPKNGKTICLDFSSINIAKPFHIGHLLTTVIGGSLYQIFHYLGFKTVGINHLGDWGTQFGKMITAYLKWGETGHSQELDVGFLTQLYVRFHEEAEKDETLNEQGRAWFKKLEEGDEEALKLFRKFKEITLREVKKVYKELGIHFDSYKGESFFNRKVKEVVRILKKKKLLSESEGAQVVNLDAYNMPPCLILKSDGTTLYATRDIATAIYRQKTYHFDQCLYVVAYQQNLHFKQFFKVLELMGYDWADKCVHVPFGMVSLENGGALSTRKGNVVLLKDVIHTSVTKAYDTIERKNPKLEKKRHIAAMIGVGAVIFGALSTSRIKDLVFSYDKALNFDGETGPYIQYMHARCCSVTKKKQPSGNKVDFSLLCDEQSRAVIKLLNAFDDVVTDAAEKYEPSFLSRYLIDLAQAYNRFYIDNRIITEDVALTDARLLLTECVKNTLRNGLKLILIKAPEYM